MRRLIASNSVAPASADTEPTSGTPQYATDGNPASGVAATDWPAYAWNMIQEELMAIQTAGGITGAANDWTGLLKAMRNLFGVYAADTSPTANALVVTLSPAPTALTDGMVLRVRPANSNTGATTVNVNGLGAVDVYSASGAPLVGGEIIVNWPVELIYNALGSVFVLAAPAFATSNSFRHMTVFTTSGAVRDGVAISGWSNGGLWTVPAGVTRIRIRGVGGGGGGAGYAAGNADMPGCGGGGGYFEGIYAVVPGTTYAITVGAGGLGGFINSTGQNGSSGGATSFSSLATATGGGGGVAGSNPAGGAGGTASGGLINVQGGDGTDGLFVTGVTTSANILGGPGLGGSTPLGGGARAGIGLNGFSGRGYGGGGAAPYDGGSTSYFGGSGASGVVIVED